MTQEFIDIFKDSFIPFVFVFGFYFGLGLFGAKYVLHTLSDLLFQFLDWVFSRGRRKN